MELMAHFYYDLARDAHFVSYLGEEVQLPKDRQLIGNIKNGAYKGAGEMLVSPLLFEAMRLLGMRSFNSKGESDG